MTERDYSSSNGDKSDNFKHESKYKQFSNAIERALKAFELSTEWHDLISALARLNKVLLAYMQYSAVPHSVKVCKRLTQCLHPNLPSGVHIKTLDVYVAIFDRIGPAGLASSLLQYSSGLFPLISYSSMNVKSRVIQLYEQYYLPLGDNLRPALHGLVLGLLPGLEDGSEYTEQITRLLDSVCDKVDLSFYCSALWKCVLWSPDVRVPAAGLIAGKLDKRLTAEDQVHLLGGSLPLMVAALSGGLGDKNVLAVRSLLDILTILFPLHKPFLLPDDITTITIAALETLLKRDISLNKRLFSWLLGANFDRTILSQDHPEINEHNSYEILYFKAFTAKYIKAALKRVCSRAVSVAKRASAAKLECIQPYRLLRILCEKQELTGSILSQILLEIVLCLREQVDCLGGVPVRGVASVSLTGVLKTPSDELPKKLSRKAALKQEIIQSANLLFNTLAPGQLWKWLTDTLDSSFTASDTSDNGLSHDKAVGIAKFLLKVLSLDSIENVHIVYLPQLAISLLNQAKSSASSAEVALLLELNSCIIHELMRPPSSAVSTPATPAGGKTTSRTPTPSQSSEISEKLVVEFIELYLSLFPQLLSAGGELLVCLCDQLTLLAKYSSSLELTTNNGQASSDWIDCLIAICTQDWSSHDHHVTFRALETLLTLQTIHTFPGMCSSTISRELITQPLFSALSTNQTFTKNVTECLWSCLSWSTCQARAADLLSRLSVLFSSPAVSETVILEKFSTSPLQAAQCFTTLWEHSAQHKHLTRCTLRMLEGLKSDSPSLRHLVGSWVNHLVSHGNQVMDLLQPLVKIMSLPPALRRPVLDQESENYRIGMSLSIEDAQKDQAYAKYYYDSLGIPDPLDFARSGQHCKIACHYCQVIDTKQLLYGISLLFSAVKVAPQAMVVAMGNAVVESSEDSKRSLLEVVIALCVDLLRSEYSSALEASYEQHLDNLNVRIASVELLSSLVGQLARLPLEADSRWSSSFVTALVTLCDVQKTTLLILGRVVKELRAFKTKETNSWSQFESAFYTEFMLESFLNQLLMLVYSLVAMDMHCNSKQTLSSSSSSSESSGLKSCDNEWLPPVMPGLPTGSQAFLVSLVLDILTDTNLAHLHSTLLFFVNALLPNLMEHQLAELSSKVLKKICSILEKCYSKKNNSSQDLTCLYLNCLCSIVSWCLYGEFRSYSEGIDLFWRRIRSSQPEPLCLPTSPTAKQPSTMSWLFTVFSSAPASPLAAPDTVPTNYNTGINSRAGQSVLMLMPALYKAMADIWRGAGEKSAPNGQLFKLLSSILCGLAHREPTAFFSSMSHVWMEWNLESVTERKVKRKDVFIDLLHQIKALPLSAIIDSVQTTLYEIGAGEEKQASLLRQKYLLHFLYKYISCNLQSSEELGGCSGQLVCFLRDLQVDTAADNTETHCHIICMLTSIFHVVICRVPTPDSKKNKKERKELQDLIHKLCEELGAMASTGPQPASHDNHVTDISRARTHSPTSGHYSDSSTSKGGRTEDGPVTQALAVLSNVLSHFVDCAYEGAEKDKVVVLLKTVLTNVWPHLQSYSLETAQSYLYSVKLLSSLSGFQVSRKAWRKEALDLYLSQSFFKTELSSLKEWRVVIDNLMTQDNVTFRDLLSRVHPSSSGVNLFTSVEQEVSTGVRLLKRVAFALFAGDSDQFVELLPDIQEKLSEYLRLLRHPPILGVVMLVFRVLLLRFSPSHLMAFWPAITAETLSLLAALNTDLSSEAPLSTDKLSLNLSLCKLLDTLTVLPSQHLPHYQLLRWGFSDHTHTDSTSQQTAVSRICRKLKEIKSPSETASGHMTPPYLHCSHISSLHELKPLFTALANHERSGFNSSQGVMDRVEGILLNDFIEK